MTGSDDDGPIRRTVPDRIGRLEVLGRLGAGATATVWRAHDPVLQSDVAVKVLADTLLNDADVRRRFEQEAQLLRAADSDALVRVHDVGELPDGRPYLVMTYADGGTLEDRAGAPWPVAQALLTGAALADAVAVLHAGGALHRDVKPSNVLYATGPAGERLLLADLGLGKAIDNASQLTLAVGTPGYAAPEQLRAGQLTAAADVFGIAAVVYRLLTGQPPTTNRPGRRSSPERPERPGDLVPGVHPGVDAAVMAGLADDPARRPQSAQAYASVLRRAALLAPPRRRRRPGLRRLLRGIAAATVLSLALLGTGYGVRSWDAGRTTAVTDVTGRIRVTVPRAWAHETAGAGWDPDGSGPLAGLSAGTDLAAAGRHEAGAAAVFVGVAPADARYRLRAAPNCSSAPSTPADNGGWRGTFLVQLCGRSRVEMAVLTGGDGAEVVFQVTEPEDQHRGRQIVGTLSVAADPKAPTTASPTS